VVAAGDPADVVYAEVLAELAEHRCDVLGERAARQIANAVWAAF